MLRRNNIGIGGEDGQAMLEYVLLTTVVVVLSISSYLTGWVQGIQGNLQMVLLLVSLPCP